MRAQAAARAADEGLREPPQQQPPPQPRNQRALAPNDARHTITRNRSERSAANSDDARHTIVQRRENREADTETSSSRLGPKCFGKRITGERYPEGFKGPRGVPIYEANMDPKTWIDNYAMAMDIVNATDLICVVV